MLSKASQSLLKELEDQKHALDQAAIVAATDAQGRISYVNDKFCEISGYDRTELLGQNHRLINSGHHRPEFFQDLWGQIRQGHIWKGEIRNRAKSGRLYWVQTTIVPFLDPEGKPYQYLSIRQDITPLKDAQELIHDQQSKLILSSRLSALGELSAALSHEINNPLAVILGRTEMMMKLLNSSDPSMETIRGMVESIEVTGRRIEKIMKTVRALAHGGEGESVQDVCLKELVDSVVDIASGRMVKDGIRFEIEGDLSGKTLSCRPTEIFQILVNLLNNAHDAVMELPKPWVRLICKVDENKRMVFSVMDSGKGLSEEVVEKLFRPFFTTKGVGVGTGLGLTISMSLAARNNADLWYDRSSPNTCFHLRLNT